MTYFIVSFVMFLILTPSVHASDGKKPQDKLITVPAGCYLMGNTFGDSYYTEMPVHEVCISSFSISPYPVTRGEFAQFATETGFRTGAEKNDGCYVYNGDSWKKDPAANWRSPGFPQGDDHPVVCVNWSDSVAYAEWLTKRNNRHYRLPTEAEWEYAARSGGKQERFAGGNDIDKVAWHGGNSGNSTHPVGQKQPNGLGIYDMSGNAWQWTEDWYDKRYYRESSRNDPRGSAAGTKKIFRGGSWFYDQRGARTTYRDFATPDFSSSYLGFRLASPTP